MTFKMTWALIGEHMDEWTGDNYKDAATVLGERIGRSVAASRMSTAAQADFLKTFLNPAQEGVLLEGRAAVSAGRGWSKAVGPLLVALTPQPLNTGTVSSESSGRFTSSQ
ncbi:hypothetical protein AB0J38_29860 [Streptomyces sp. NPDC050095]|uniref:hypothetical protein n=1 Tax=unclassified Streptomyces TaxID=2593676 RepID=UPI003441679C